MTLPSKRMTMTSRSSQDISRVLVVFHGSVHGCSRVLISLYNCMFTGFTG
jgi:hypothetical protein